MFKNREKVVLQSGREWVKLPCANRSNYLVPMLWPLISAEPAVGEYMPVSTDIVVVLPDRGGSRGLTRQCRGRKDKNPPVL